MIHILFLTFWTYISSLSELKDFRISCDFLESDPIGCSNHGICILNTTVNTSTCQCDEYFSGRECEYTECFGISSSELGICNARGNCVSPNLCKCDAPLNWGGKNCNEKLIDGKHTCFGISSKSEEVCGGRGTCISHDNCSCHLMYHGKYCNVSECFGKLENENNVCNGHGICSGLNKCDCSPIENYGGRECEEEKCFGTSIFSKHVCSGHGTCISGNFSCLCDVGYGNNECEPLCEGHCNGHGKCVSPNKCVCENGYDGEGYSKQCEELTFFEDLVKKMSIQHVAFGIIFCMCCSSFIFLGVICFPKILRKLSRNSFFRAADEYPLHQEIYEVERFHNYNPNLTTRRIGDDDIGFIELKNNSESTSGFDFEEIQEFNTFM